MICQIPESSFPSGIDERQGLPVTAQKHSRMRLVAIKRSLHKPYHVLASSSRMMQRRKRSTSLEKRYSLGYLVCSALCPSLQKQSSNGMSVIFHHTDLDMLGFLLHGELGGVLKASASAALRAAFSVSVVGY